MLIFVIACFLSFDIHASDWKTIQHHEDGFSITMSFKREVQDDGVYAAPLHFNVYGAKPGARIRVVLNSLASILRKTSKATFILDLNRQPEGHYWNEFGNSMRVTHHGLASLLDLEKSLLIHGESELGPIFYMQEISVVIDGKWLKTFCVNLSQI